MCKCVLKYPGSKWRIAKWIISKMPQHHSYVEPFFGSGAVLFNKPISNIETINDIDNRVYLLFKMIREQPELLARSVELTPYCRHQYELTYTENGESNLDKVMQLLIQCWQGYGFRTNGYKVGWKNDVQGREKSYALKNWNKLPAWIIDSAQRLKQVQIENMPAIDLIKRFNYENVLLYCDPPYLLETRSGKQYKYEMDKKQHIELLETLIHHTGSVMLSGYDSDLYNTALEGWSRLEIKSNAEGGAMRNEVIWTNFKPTEQISFDL